MLDFGSKVKVLRIFDRHVMQLERIAHTDEFVGAGFVQADPDEPGSLSAAPGGLFDGHHGGVLAVSVPVMSTVHDHGGSPRGSVILRSWHLETPPGCTVT